MTRLPALGSIVTYIFHPIGFVSLGNPKTCVSVHVHVCEYGRMHANLVECWSSASTSCERESVVCC